MKYDFEFELTRRVVITAIDETHARTALEREDYDSERLVDVQPHCEPLESYRTEHANE